MGFNNNLMLKKTNKSGFTLIELLVVIAIIAVISAIVLQSLSSARTSARNVSRTTAIDQINKALELSVTGGNISRFPSSSGYACLGLDADTMPASNCGGSFNPTNVAVNAQIKANLAGNIIPLDPYFVNELGSTYLYNSNLAPIVTGNCTAVLCPAGAYLSWVIEKDSAPSASSNTCGRGIYAIEVTPGSKYQCFLRIGNAI